MNAIRRGWTLFLLAALLLIGCDGETEITDVTDLLGGDDATPTAEAGGPAPQLVTGAELLGMTVVARGSEQSGIVLDALFDENGTILAYLVRGIDAEAAGGQGEGDEGVVEEVEEAVDEAFGADGEEARGPYAAIRADALQPARPEDAEGAVEVTLLSENLGPAAASVPESVLNNPGLFVQRSAVGLPAGDPLARLARLVGPTAGEFLLLDENAQPAGELEGVIADVFSTRLLFVVVDVDALAAGRDDVVVPWSAVDIVGQDMILAADQATLVGVPTTAGDPAERFTQDGIFREQVIEFWRGEGFLE